MITPTTDMRVRGLVKRPQLTKPINGASVIAGFSPLVPTHWAEIENLSEAAVLQFTQLKMQVSHRIYPQLRNVSSIQPGDFYFIGDRHFEIVNAEDADGRPHLLVWEGSDKGKGRSESSGAFYSFSGVLEGTHNYGSSPLSPMASLDSAPNAMFQSENASGFYVPTVGSGSLEIVDRGIGQPPQVRVDIWESIGGSGERYHISGLSAGEYTFGVGPLASLPPIFDQAPDVFGYAESDGSYYIEPPTRRGFEIVDTSIIGGGVSVCVTIWPKATIERRWSFSGLVPGNYSFGENSLASVPNLAKKPIIYSENNNPGGHGS